MSDTAQPSFKDKMMKALGKFSGSRFVRSNNFTTGYYC